MDNFPNSRKLNGISLVECLENKVTDKENQFSVLVRSPRIDQSFVKRYRQQQNNLVPKSLKTLFKKITGTPVNTNTTSTITTTNNTSLSPSSPNKSTSILHSRHPPSSINKKSIKKSNKNYHLPTIVTHDNHPQHQFRRTSSYRHTLDLSYTMTDFQLKPARRANSLCHTTSSSIYSTFSNSPSSSASSSFLSSSSCIEVRHPYHQEQQQDSSNQIQHQQIHQNTIETVAAHNDHHTLQNRLWNEDITLCPKEQIAEWLGSKPETRSKVLKLYMDNFDFSETRLDEAFRMLCSKLYLKGESQQLDRIIEAFAKRYFECNPNTLLQCEDVVYAVAYSLLLLNTDLHVVSDWANKMTRNSFVKNTMETIHSLIFPDIDYKRRSSTVSFQSTHSDCAPPPTPTHPLDSATGSSSEDMVRPNLPWRQTNESLINRTQKNGLGEIENLLKEMYNAVKSNRIDQANKKQIEPTHTNLYRSRTLPKNEIAKSQSFRRRRGQSVISPFDSKVLVPTHELKHGLVMRKHVMESTDKRARHRQWQLCYLVMNDTQLIMHRAIQQSNTSPVLFEPRARRRRSMMLWNQSVCSLQDIIQEEDIEDWQADEKVSPLGILEMNHTFTTSIPPPGWNGQRPHVFRVETGEGGLWLFESMDMFAVQAWVEAANTTAAKISKGPLTGAVSNIDYGWGPKWDDSTSEFTMENVPVWFPPSPCMVKSTLELTYQYYDLEAQIEVLHIELNRHRELKLSLDLKFLATVQQTGLNTTQALTNWDRKLHYLLHEIVKLKCYKENIYPLISLQ